MTRKYVYLALFLAGTIMGLALIRFEQSPSRAALSVAAAMEGKAISVLMAYADRLERFTRWYVQLWAESLGKDCKGTTPIAALGPVDQHSQLQLYLAGPRDKLFTIVTVSAAGRGPRIADDLARLAGEQVDQLQPGAVAVLQVGQLVGEHHRVRAPVAVEDGHRRLAVAQHGAGE